MIKELYYRILDFFIMRKRLKELRKRDPYIYEE
jgi:hypothetical protein